MRISAYAALLAAAGLAAGAARAEVTSVKIGVLNDQSGPYTNTGGITGVICAKQAVEAEKVALSTWEGEFLGSVETRVERYGRAFRDPEKGGPGAALSMLQAQKLKEIGAKAKGRKSGLRRSRVGSAG